MITNLLKGTKGCSVVMMWFSVGQEKGHFAYKALACRRTRLIKQHFSQTTEQTPKITHL